MFSMFCALTDGKDHDGNDNCASEALCCVLQQVLMEKQSSFV